MVTRKSSAFLNENLIKEFRELIKKSKEGENILSVSELKSSGYILYQFLLAFIVFTILIFVLGREEIYWIWCAIVIFSFFISKLIFLLIHYYKVSKSFVYFDENIVIKRHLDTVEFAPLHQLSSVNQLEPREENKLLLNLIFDNEIIYFFLNKSKRANVEQFSKNILEKSTAIKTKKIDLNSTPWNSILEDSSLENHNYQKPLYLAIFTALSSVVLFSLLPFFLDWNSFRKAEDINTATSLREYLREEKNYLFKEEAKNLIKQKYNLAIYQYSNINNNENNAIVQILEHLKNNDIYKVDIIFTGNNKIKDISRKYDVSINSAEYSFTQQKNRDREEELISTLNNTLGSIFPSDIIRIENVSDNDNTPKIEIIYSYQNSEEGSLYYPVSQEHLSESLRDYYYGLTIYWDFKLFIPEKDTPIYGFTLKSNPAIQFSSDSYNTDDVYSNMVYSAFKDFDTEFKNHFFEK